MNRRKFLVVLIALALGGAWYAFRPERLFINTTVDEGFPKIAAPQGATASSTPLPLLSGRFHGVAHETSGEATIYQTAGGQRLLRLSGFATSNGPDVRVYLVAASDAADNATVTRAGFVELGRLKGNRGDQNYDVPPEVDLARYRSVTIWCRRFGVNFGTAPLAEDSAKSARAKEAASSPLLLSIGRFHEVAHETTGEAAIYQLPGGKRILRLTDFETSNGPDVRVYLVAAQDAADNQTVKDAGFIELGRLKGNRGDQNYEVPGEVDLSKYRSITIWCRRFGVNFGTAPLTPRSS